MRSAEETWEILYPHLRELGISRVADITGLDRIGVPIYQSFRPWTKYPVTVFAGKGVRAIESKVSSVMEAFEAFAFESFSPKVEKTIERDTLVARLCPPLDWNPDPERIWKTLPLRRLTLNAGNLSWGPKAHAPVEAVAMPSPVRQDHLRWLPNTNGIASGNTIYEALLSAIYEVIERDAQSIALVARSGRMVSEDLLESNDVRAVMQAIRRAELRVWSKDITSDLGIPTFYSVIEDPDRPSLWFKSGGAGCHHWARIALLRSLTEAIQARNCMIAGSREDLRSESIKAQLDHDKTRNILRYWFSDSGLPARTYEVQTSDSSECLLKETVRSLELSGLEVYALEVKNPIPKLSDKLYFVRTLITEAECFALDRSRIGKRLNGKQASLLGLAKRSLYERDGIQEPRNFQR